MGRVSCAGHHFRAPRNWNVPAELVWDAPLWLPAQSSVRGASLPLFRRGAPQRRARDAAFDATDSRTPDIASTKMSAFYLKRSPESHNARAIGNLGSWFSFG